MNLFQTFERNTVGSDFVVGDIHGCFSKLEEQLDVLSFDPLTDRLFSVGDLVDRGPECDRVVEFINKPWFFPVRGNHEKMLLDCFAGKEDPWLYSINGGRWFLDLLKPEQKVIADELCQLPYAIEVDTENGLTGIVHAEVPGHDWNEVKGQLTDQHREEMLWFRSKIRTKDERVVKNIDRVFVGHTPLKKVVTLGNVHYIDTGAVFGNQITIVRL